MYAEIMEMQTSRMNFATSEAYVERIFSVRDDFIAGENRKNLYLGGSILCKLNSKPFDFTCAEVIQLHTRD